MNDLEYKIKVMQHFADGGKIEAQNYDGSWFVVERPVWNWNTTNYIIKEEPKKTKEVFEWYYISRVDGNIRIADMLFTEEEAKQEFKASKSYHKTGRSWIVECE